MGIGLEPATHVAGGCRIVEFEQLHQQAVRGGNHDVSPAVVFPEAVGGRDALSLQTRPDIAQVVDPDTEMVDAAPASISGGLIIDVETPIRWSPRCCLQTHERDGDRVTWFTACQIAREPRPLYPPTMLCLTLIFLRQTNRRPA